MHTNENNKHSHRTATCEDPWGEFYRPNQKPQALLIIRLNLKMQYRRCSLCSIPKEDASPTFLRIMGNFCVISPISLLSQDEKNHHRDMITSITRWVSRVWVVLVATGSSLNGPLSHTSDLLFLFNFPRDFDFLWKFMFITKIYINDKMAFLETLTTAVALLWAVEGAAMWVNHLTFRLTKQSWLNTARDGISTLITK